jgi:hypothetical protein
MMEAMLVSVILSLCDKDLKLYKVQDEKVSCQEYYVNCIVNKKGTWGTRELEWCSKHKGD